MISSKRLRAASTCSTACCRRATDATAWPSPGTARSISPTHVTLTDSRPLDAESPHPAARTYSRAYLHHLTKANEMLGAVLLSTINLAYYQTLMAGMREAIAARRFADFRDSYHGAMGAGRSAGALARRGCLARVAWLKAAHERRTPDFSLIAASRASSFRRAAATRIATCLVRQTNFPMRQTGATRRPTRQRKCWRRCTRIWASSAR